MGMGRSVTKWDNRLGDRKSGRGQVERTRGSTMGSQMWRDARESAMDVASKTGVSAIDMRDLRLSPNAIIVCMHQSVTTTRSSISLILLAHPRQPLSPFILAHLPEQPRPLRLALRHGLILGRTADSNLYFVCLEVGRAHCRERFDSEFNDGCTIEHGLGVLEGLELFVKLRRETKSIAHSGCSTEGCITHVVVRLCLLLSRCTGRVANVVSCRVELEDLWPSLGIDTDQDHGYSTNA